MTGNALEIGSINKYDQLNLGPLATRPNMKKCYLMHCLHCGETHATQSQIYQRRCPSRECRQFLWGGGKQSNVALTPDERPETVDGRRRQAIEVLAKRLNSLGASVAA